MSQNFYHYSSIKAMSDAGEDTGESLSAWNNQSGGQIYYVIYNGDIFHNIGWLERWHIPDRDLAAEIPVYENAWRYLRAATAEEIARHGNPDQPLIPPGIKPMFYCPMS